MTSKTLLVLVLLPLAALWGCQRAAVDSPNENQGAEKEAGQSSTDDVSGPAATPVSRPGDAETADTSSGGEQEATPELGVDVGIGDDGVKVDVGEDGVNVDVGEDGVKVDVGEEDVDVDVDEEGVGVDVGGADASKPQDE